MKPVPWAKIRDWSCLACGECCKWFVIPLRADELARILHAFGDWAIEFKLAKAYIRKPSTRSRCIFQYKMRDKWLCLLQEMDMKPVACKLWPFIPLTKPKYGRSREAAFEHSGERFFVYVDPRCPGIVLGTPSSYLIQKVLPEVIELRLGLKKHQDFTTSHLKLPVKEQRFTVTPSKIVGYHHEAGSLYSSYPMNRISTSRLSYRLAKL